MVLVSQMEALKNAIWEESSLHCIQENLLHARLSVSQHPSQSGVSRFEISIFML